MWLYLTHNIKNKEKEKDKKEENEEVKKN